MRTNVRALLAALALPASAAACGAAEPSVPAPPAGAPVKGDQTVVLDSNAFEPAALRVAPGTTITWEWADESTPHNVTFDKFSSDTQAQGAHRHTFDMPGEFAYRCTLHPRMTGLVVVQ